MRIKTRFPETLAYRAELILRDFDIDNRITKEVPCGGCNKKIYEGWRIWIITCKDLDQPIFCCTEMCVNLWRELQKDGAVLIQRDIKIA